MTGRARCHKWPLTVGAHIGGARAHARQMAMITEFGEERQRRLILDYFGGDARLRLLRRTPTFGSPVFVVDFDRGARHFRTLGSFGSSIQVTEQSSMDLLYPARLVFHYERLMSLAFAMCPQAITGLLLGVGGAAMWRFMRAYLPDCAPTLVDADEAVAAIARRWFYLTQPVIVEPAQQFVATTTERFDVVLVDLYNSSGPAESNELFWSRCLDVLNLGGCFATNWADFSVNPAVRPMADALEAVARARGFTPIYVTRRGFRDNLVQYVPTAPGIAAEAMTEIHARFVQERRPPDRGRGILENCIVTTRFPIE
jgi:predicted O-methyltransferase YrrM